MPLFVVTIFLSAFLLFQVQPIVARYILPWYGGSPAVWTTCMLFFQFGLLGGYAYAHWLASVFRGKRVAQFWVHSGVVLLALVFMPITPAEALKPLGGAETSNLWGIVKLLACSVGLPYVAISASGPLLQHWFAGTHPGVSPYRLYAVSNLGSLLGLLSYPFLFQPVLGLKHQTWWWSIGFAVYGGVALWCAWRYARADPSPADQEQRSEVDHGGKAGLLRMVLWVLLAALGSASMLAITNQMSQDIAVVPFLWVLPLSLYLTSFIICFERSIWYNRLVWVALMLVAMGALVYLLNQQLSGDEIHIVWQIGIYLLTLFSVCMVCHGEMARLKPASRYLTTFYLLMSLGGALGGVFVSLIAPLIFDGYWELHAILLLATLVIGLVISWDLNQRAPFFGRLSRFDDSTIKFSPVASASLLIALVSLVAMGLGLRAHYRETQSGAIESLRNFHGVIRTYEFDKGTDLHYRALYHGRICHGRQYLDENDRNTPTSYYGLGSGVGAVMRSIPQRLEQPHSPVKMGVVGLGSGSLAVYARPGDDIVFYEINPLVEQMARKQFYYLSDCLGETEVVLGDARTSLENELAEGSSREFDVLFVDAFSGDSIPMHLLTAEAFDVYFNHIKEGGCLVCHITNLHIDLSDPIRQLAKKHDSEALLVSHYPDDYDDYLMYFSEWVIVTKNKHTIARLRKNSSVIKWRTKVAKEIHWTDDYSNLLDVIDFDGIFGH